MSLTPHSSPAHNMPSPSVLLDEAIQAAGTSEDRRQAQGPNAETFANVKDPAITDIANCLESCPSDDDTVEAMITFIVTAVDHCSAKKEVRNVVGIAAEYLRLYHRHVTKERVKDHHVVLDASQNSSTPEQEGAFNDRAFIKDTLATLQLQVAAIHGAVDALKQQPASYAEVAARAPSPKATQPKHTPTSSNSHNPDVDIIIDIAPTDKKDPIRSLKDHHLKTHVEQAMLGIEAIADIPLHGVSHTAKGMIILRTRTPAHAAQIGRAHV